MTTTRLLSLVAKQALAKNRYLTHVNGAVRPMISPRVRRHRLAQRRVSGVFDTVFGLSQLCTSTNGSGIRASRTRRPRGHENGGAHLLREVPNMRTAMLTALLTIATPLVILGQSTRSGSTTDRSAEDEIRRLNTEEVDAFLHHDVKTLASLWSDDFVVTNPLNRVVTKPQVLGMVESGTLAFTSFERRVEYVHFYDETAVVVGSESVVWAGKLPMAGKSNDLRFTSVWIKQKGRWQQVARHANIIPPQ